MSVATMPTADEARAFIERSSLGNPLLAPDEVRSVVAPDGRVDVETAVSDDEVDGASELSVARLYRHDELAGDATNWFAAD
jgi:hypothetical protein